MILPLRRLHRRAFVGLAAVVPALFVAGLLSRSPIPRMEPLPDPLAGPTGWTALASAEDDLWDGVRIRTTSALADGRPVWVLEPLEELRHPDLLVYYLPRPFEPGCTLGVCAPAGPVDEKALSEGIAWLEDEGWTVPVIMDDEQLSAVLTYGMRGTPFYVVLDGDNLNLGRVSGEVGIAGLDQMVRIAQASIDS